MEKKNYLMNTKMSSNYQQVELHGVSEKASKKKNNKEEEEDDEAP